MNPLQVVHSSHLLFFFLNTHYRWCILLIFSFFFFFFQTHTTGGADRDQEALGGGEEVPHPRGQSGLVGVFLGWCMCLGRRGSVLPFSSLLLLLYIYMYIPQTHVCVYIGGLTLSLPHTPHLKNTRIDGSTPGDLHGRGVGGGCGGALCAAANQVGREVGEGGGGRCVIIISVSLERSINGKGGTSKAKKKERRKIGVGENRDKRGSQIKGVGGQGDG